MNIAARQTLLKTAFLKSKKYRFFKFTSYKQYGIGTDVSKQNQVQLSRIEFLCDNIQFLYPSTTTYISHYGLLGDQQDTNIIAGCNKLLDHNVNTKMCWPIDSIPWSITYDIGNGNYLDFVSTLQWQWWMAGDSADTSGNQQVRNPISFSMSLSDNNIDWYELDRVDDYPLILENYALAYTGKLF